VDPGNTVLPVHSLLEPTDATIMMNNDICRRNLDSERPAYTNLNRFFVQILSSLNAVLRLDGARKVDIVELQPHLVPYPRFHFMLSSHARVIPAEKAYHEHLSGVAIPWLVTAPPSRCVKCEPRHWRYVACCMMCRGAAVPKDVDAAVATIRTKRTIQFADRCPTVHHQPPTGGPGGDLARVMRTYCMTSNSTVIVRISSATSTTPPSVARVRAPSATARASSTRPPAPWRTMGRCLTRSTMC